MSQRRRSYRSTLIVNATELRTGAKLSGAAALIARIDAIRLPRVGMIHVIPLRAVGGPENHRMIAESADFIFVAHPVAFFPVFAGVAGVHLVCCFAGLFWCASETYPGHGANCLRVHVC